MLDMLDADVCLQLRATRERRSRTHEDRSARSSRLAAYPENSTESTKKDLQSSITV
jgi:hypothetical protein